MLCYSYRLSRISRPCEGIYISDLVEQAVLQAADQIYEAILPAVGVAELVVKPKCGAVRWAGERQLDTLALLQL